MSRPGLQKKLDRWFPTMLHYAGLALIVYAVVWRPDLTSNVTFWPGASAMVLYKYVVGDGERE